MTSRIAQITFPFFVFFASVVHVGALPDRLAIDDRVFPIGLEFPGVPDRTAVPNPMSEDLWIYQFGDYDQASGLSYGVVITELPSEYRSVSEDDAETMAYQLLLSQIDSVDRTLGVIGDVFRIEHPGLNDLPYDFLLVERATNPPTAGY